VAGGEAARHLLGRQHRDRAGQHRVERAQQRQPALIGADLAERVDAAVGAAGDGQLGRRAQDRRERRLEHALHRPLTRLDGPPHEGRAVVGQS
jgi:hypothetical protein